MSNEQIVKGAAVQEVAAQGKSAERMLYQIAPGEDDIAAVDKRELAAPVTSIADAIEDAEKRVEVYKKIRLVSLKSTAPQDWLNHHGNPYLTDDGAKAVAKIWGIDIFGLKVWKDFTSDENGPYFIVYASGKAYSKSLKAYVEDIGVCSQHDEFFGVADKKFKALSDLDEGSITKAAVTNLRQRLIKAIVGLKNVTWDELAQAGFNVEQIKAGKVIEGKAGGQKQKASLTDADKQLLDKIRTMARRIADAQEIPPEDVLYDCTKFIGSNGQERGARTPEEITTPGWIRKSYANMKDLYAQVFPQEQNGGKE
jgi:hypothetical protein